MSSQLDRLANALSDRYRIERELGAGGMATVYLAQDLKHDRKVALKVLKSELAAVLGADRFVVEIKTTARLQHPHILPLFDSGTADGFLYYVMPFIEGETLRDKLNRETQLGVDEAVRIAREVADALDYAHGKGVIHRDIKPENILIQNGRPMVADFGIALAVSAAAGGRMTETGLSLGTPHYMSPEQATAEKEISARSDVYSLASVLYEMLAGQPPHSGGSAQQIIMKIITETAPPVTQLRRSVPPNVSAALTRALEKLPADRFASAKGFAEALANPSFAAATSTRAVAPPRTEWRRSDRFVPWAVGAGLLVLAAWGWMRTPPEPPFHVSIPAPAGTTFIPNPRWPAISPDGRTVVFAAMSNGTSRLYRRPVDGFRAEAIEGSEDATYPFFSPDGEWVAYYTKTRQIRKVPLAGGGATTVTDIPFWRSGAFWRKNGTIVVVSDARGLYVVPDHGGALAPLTDEDSVIAGDRLEQPREMRDGSLVATRRMQERGLFGGGRLVMLAEGEPDWRLVSKDHWGLYVEPGFLISRPSSGALATQFDLSNGSASGNPQAVLEGFGYELMDLSLNERGDIAYFAFPTERGHFLTLVDRNGIGRRIPIPAKDLRHPRISPDGTRLAGLEQDDIWILDFRTNAWSRVTTNANTTEPQWSSDGKRLAHTVFDSTTGYNPPAVRNADGNGNARMIPSDFGDSWTSDWSADNRYLAVYGGKTGMNVSVVDVDSGTVRHVTSGATVARNPRFSPDGRWLAYQSNETGRMQVYLVSFPGLDRKRPISTEGGTEPAWNRNGGQLFYRNGASMMVVPIRTSPTLDVGTPRALFRGPFLEDTFGDRSYDVMPDGEHFIMLEANPAAAPELRVVRHWIAELKATVGKR